MAILAPWLESVPVLSHPASLPFPPFTLLLCILSFLLFLPLVSLLRSSSEGRGAGCLGRDHVPFLGIGGYASVDGA